MKGKTWASWLLAGLVALGQAPLTATAAMLPVAQPVVVRQPVSVSAPVVLTRKTAQQEVRALQAVANAVHDEQEAFDDWQDAIRRADQLDTEKMTVKTPFGDMEIKFSDKVQLQLRQQKYLVPDQMAYTYRLKAMGTTMTVLSLENAMDSLLLGLHAAQEDILSKTRARDLAVQTLARTEASLAAGRVMQIDVDADALALKKAEAALSASKRSLENLMRNYNQFVGMPLDRQVEVDISPEVGMPLLAADDYVLQALENRMELVQLRGILPIYEERAELLTFKDLYLYDPEIRLDREGVLLDLEKSRAQLPETQRNITVEIRAAWLEMKTAALDIQSLEDNIATQKRKLRTLEANIDAGRIPAYAADALRNGIADMESGLVTSRLSLDNDIRKFRQATGIGPALQ